jgi:gliding motility-associated-like protein
VNTSGGTGFQYSLNGGAFQASNIFSGLNSGTYTVLVKSGSCSASALTSITLNNNLTVSALPSDTTICAGATFTPRVTSSNASPNYSWTPSSGLAAPIPGVPYIPAITVPNVNTQYIVTSTLGPCQAKDTIKVTSITGATANAGPDVTIIAGDQVQLQGSGSAGTYLWSPATALSATNVLKPFASPTATTVYTFQVTSPQGCTATDFVQVNVVPYCVKPMEAFTPNGDGINDLWMVTNGTCLKAAKAEVFNRYGARVFESQDYKNNWDGTFKGKPLPDGTYYFVITYQLINSKTVYLKGNVTILR